ncbi:MAG: carph-isopro domain-containing protein [Thalassobaculum sp.]
MNVAKAIVDKFGGTRKMAEHTGLPPSTIQSWKSSGLIPAHKQSEVLRLAVKLGIDVSPADFFDLPAGYGGDSPVCRSARDVEPSASDEATEAA